MGFTFSNANIRENQIVFIYEENAFMGVRKIAGRVREDIETVFGAKPIGVEDRDFRDTAGFFSYPVFFGTVGHSAILDGIAAKGAIDLFDIAGESEVYSLSIIDGLEYEGFTFESAIVIAGSDKRGTIYGLFRLSEMLGVSPLSGWLDVCPERRSELTLSKEDSVISKTPSVRYRGFFINDEWPAFGSFCNKNHGGFTVKVYEKVFELLLRLKGNYLWPAMWSSVFADDGPGQASARLADELGVIMGTSHHEPCMRQGEEYSHVRGPGSEYGDAWDFTANRDGIIKFWQDGIAARSEFENVYTVGMRGEADTAICREGSVADNIALLRDVIRTQNRLIGEGLGQDVGSVPRLFVVYKEVERFFYGDGTVTGLCNDPELDGVTVMLSDDNYGNLRTVPPEDMRDRRGGWGLYYHLDYHGLPVSYEWFNTNYLPKIWEEMTEAFDHGIRQAWMVNVGDIFTHEYPLAFFMDLAYDFDRWGTLNRNSAADYTKEFVRKNFSGLTEEERSDIEALLLGYTKITSARRTEAMNDSVYAPFAYGECDALIKECAHLMDMAQSMYKAMPDHLASAFYEIVYLPLCATLNIQKMWALTSQNHAYALMGSTVCNSIAKDIRDSMKADRKLVEKLHSIGKGKWYGMGLSEHIGFTHWCEEECRNPIVHTIEPATKPRLIVLIPDTGEHTEGGFWSGKTLTLTSALDPLVCGGSIELSTACEGKVSYTITTESPFLDIIEPGKSVKCGNRRRVFIFADRMKMEGEHEVGRVTVTYEGGIINIDVPVYNPKNTEQLPPNTFMFPPYEDKAHAGYVSIAAHGHASKRDTDAGSFEMIDGLGPCGSAVKAFPQNICFTDQNAPAVTYNILTDEEGKYDVRVYTTPANPLRNDGRILFGIAVNEAKSTEVNMIPDGFEVTDGNEAWEKGVLDNMRTAIITCDLKKGLNTITISARSPGFVLTKIVITPADVTLPYSYLGPGESFHT